MKIITVANRKGGVGKSWISLCLASELAKRKKCVVLIDFDSQSNLTSLLFPHLKNGSNNIYNLILKECKIEDSTFVTKENFYIIPGSPKLKYLPTNENQNALKTILSSDFLSEVEFAIIDTSPAMDNTLLKSLVASHYALSVSEPDQFSMDGLEDLRENLNDTKIYNPSIKYLGIVVNKYHCRRKLDNEYLKNLKKTYKNLVFKNIISDTADVAHSLERKQSIVNAKPSSTGSIQVKNLVDEILLRM